MRTLNSFTFLSKLTLNFIFLLFAIKSVCCKDHSSKRGHVKDNATKGFRAKKEAGEQSFSSFSKNSVSRIHVLIIYLLYDSAMTMKVAAEFRIGIQAMLVTVVGTALWMYMIEPNSYFYGYFANREYNVWWFIGTHDMHWQFNFDPSI